MQPENDCKEPHYYWCIGLYASGSTWIFNVAKKIAATAGESTGLASRFISTEAEMSWAPDTVTSIVKTHETDAGAARRLTARSVKIWLSIRDPRDCVASLMSHQDCTFEEALEMTADSAAACLALLSDPRLRLFRFEDGFFDDENSLQVIADDLACRLRTDDAKRIYAETRRSAIEAYIRRFGEIPTVVSQPEPGHYVDLDTQWHTHHAGRDGKVGRWRQALTDEQVRRVEIILREAMARFGYQPELA